VHPVDDNTRVTLRGYVHPLANAANDRGAAPDSMSLDHMHLVLKRSASQEAALQQMIAGVHTPGSASYHKWLTPAQFGQQFGPSDQDVATVTSWLSSHGFQVSGVKPGKQVIEFTGNVAQFRNAFHAQIHKYQVNGDIHYATAGDPQIPAAIAPVVGGFVALNNFRPKSHAHLLGQASYDPKTNKATPNWTYGGNAGVNFVMAPADFAVQYDLPNPALNPGYTGTTYDGSGETIAIINESNINVDLVNQFRSIFNLPVNPPTVIIDGNDPGIEGINDPDGPNYAADETYIDVEWSGAVAPGAHVDLIIAADTDLESGLYLAAEHAIYNDVAPIMSLSFGSCEAGLGSTNLYLDELMEQAAAQGITVMVSAGDGGVAGCDNFNSSEYATQGLAVSGYASTPWNVAVGGTDFYYSHYNDSGLNTQLATYWNTTPSQSPSQSILQHIPEQPWNDSQYGLDASNYYINSGGSTTIAGGSGGASSAAVCASGYNSSGTCGGALTGYAKPSWQTGAGVPTDGVRDLPDVSLFASDGTNYSFYPFCYQDGDCQSASGSGLIQISGAGGTSFAAPAFAGIMALVDQKMQSPQGQADFVLYPLKTQFPAAFHDITVGTNTEPCNVSTIVNASGTFPPVDCVAVASPLTAADGTVEGALGLTSSQTPLYSAAAGYNLATGLGTVDAAVMVADWDKVSFKTSATTLTSPGAGASYTHGQAVTVSGSVTGTGTPAGNVALMTDSSEAGQQGSGFGQLLAGGTSTFPLGSGGAFSGSVADLPGGTYDVWASYSGDGTNAASTSAKAQITVSPEASSVYFNLLNAVSTSSSSLGISPGSTGVPYGTQGTLDAEVAPTTYYNTCLNVSSPPSTCASTAFTSPTGTVTFTDNSTAINAAPINVEGDAEFNAPFSIGTHTVSASYSGDSSYNASTSSSIAFTITQDTPNVFAGAANGSQTLQNTFIGGQPTIFYVLVENSANYSNEITYSSAITTPVSAPSGTVTVTGLPSGTTSGTQTLVASVDPYDGLPAGVVQFTIPANACSSTCNYNIGISYSGDTNYVALTGSNALAGSISIVPPSPATLIPTTITGNLSSTSITPNQSITVSGTVTGATGTTAPTGSVYVYPDGDSTTAFALVPGSGATSTYSGTLTSQVLVQGGNLLAMYYTGDSTHNSSSVLVNSGNPINTPLSDFSLGASNAVVSVSLNGTNKLTTSATSTIYITPTNGFSGTVNLSVPSTCGAGLTCSLSASSVSLSYSNTASVPIQNAPLTQRWRLLATGGGAALAGVLLLTIPARRRAWRNLLSLLVFACLAGFGIGCGSSGGGGGGGCTLGPTLCGGGGGGGGTPGTATNPSQSVTLTVTAAAGATAGLHGVTVTANSTATSQIHTLGIITQVE
jgi:subtilase family serine protease